MFVDRVKIELNAGSGGDGCSSMRREKYIPRGGPDGGDGGRGGSLIFEARLGVNSLAAYGNRRFFSAPNGQQGQGAMCFGKKGEDEVLLVPPGTTVIDAEHGFVIKDLKNHGESFVIAKGGRGGRGNAKFKSSTNQAPRKFQRGEEGESRTVILELKSIADVGLVGKPNAGKSTLLSRISSARPEIADYPFTTKHPNLGIVDLDVKRAFVLADIPGLIEGASEGLGLGHEFLRHIERAGLLVHLVEPEPTDATDPIENYRNIRAELIQYDEDLGKREEILVVSKCELPSSEEVAELLRQETGKPVFVISAATGTRLNELKEEIMKRVEKRRDELVEAGEQVAVLRENAQPRTNRARRVPPHRAGLTAGLSDDVQAKDIDNQENNDGAKEPS